MMEMQIYLGDGKKVYADYKGHTVVTDQPVQSGGEDTAPAPFDLFMISLGTCAGFYVKMFCEQRNISTEGITLTQSTEYDQASRMIGKIRIEINLPVDFPEKYKDSVIAAAGSCAVKKHIQKPPAFEVVVR
ncbi:MAG: OsmC family protein [Bacteroidia bacterium]|nr:OsmC family protein [Bacteroidia bacterium]